MKVSLRVTASLLLSMAMLSACSDSLKDAQGLKPQAELTCDGRTPTIVVRADPGGANALVYGTLGPDIILDTPTGDVIYGRGGDDHICGGGGSDLIYGGYGYDYLYAMYDVYGSVDSQWRTMFGGPGNDTLYGSDGEDSLSGDGGNDTIWGDGWGGQSIGAKDGIDGGPGNDILYGGAGDDQVYDFKGGDLLNGGPGNDNIVTSSDKEVTPYPADTLYGGYGTGTIALEAAKEMTSFGVGMVPTNYMVVLAATS